ncbi:MAG: hypothetical protein JWM63_2020 [Gammaproteobacteria bacterium]|nr:hypothetical protein [Gammaproteobacteria bacterium]
MSNGIDFLERLGQDSGLRHASEAVLERALSEAHMIPELRAAILEGNQRMLETLLGVGSNVCCLSAVPLGEDPEGEKPRKADPQSIASRLHLSRTA